MRLQSNARRARHALAFRAALLSIALSIAVAPLVAQEPDAARTGPPVLFSAPLQDMQGVSLTVVELAFEPNPAPPSTAEQHRRGHRHPGSVLVYVTQGAVRLAIEGEPVQVVRAGETFFEPPRAHHIITENASATETARAIAVMIVPEGEPLTVLEPE